jgi:hypothetical protein
MKKTFTGRDSLPSRTSAIDGTIHLNRGIRDAHDAMKRAQEARKRMDESRKQAERMRNLRRMP